MRKLSSLALFGLLFAFAASSPAADTAATWTAKEWSAALSASDLRDALDVCEAYDSAEFGINRWGALGEYAKARGSSVPLLTATERLDAMDAAFMAALAERLAASKADHARPVETARTELTKWAGAVRKAVSARETKAERRADAKTPNERLAEYERQERAKAEQRSRLSRNSSQGQE